MEFWEFLIQKEGDRSWLPLESPSVEILTGRYRVVARSSRANLVTEVRVTHYAVTESPPVRRIRKRSSQTNADGLIVILPFTRLQPGVWELHCTGDVMAEMLGENWRYTVQLEVIAETAALPEPSVPEPEVPAITAAEADEINPSVTTIPAAITAAVPDSTDLAELAPTELAEVATSAELPDPILAPVDTVEAPAVDSIPVTDEVAEPVADPQNIETATPELAPPVSSPSLAEVLQQIEAQSEEMVSAAFQDLALEDLPEEPDAVSEVAPPTAPSLPQLQVVLERETYIIQRGEVVALAGKIEYLDPSEAMAEAQRLTVSELRVRLYDPQTSEMLMDEVYPIDNRVPPFPFSGTVSLPEHYQTYLVLGELIFQGSVAGSAPQVLARQSFNVTTDLHELIESIANDFPDVEALPPEAQIPVIAEPMPAVELERLAQPKFQRSTQMPPQLRQPDPTRTHASLELPTFVKPVQPDVKAVKPEVPQPPTAPIENEQSEAAISTSAADLEPLEVSLSIPATEARTGVSDALNSANQTTDNPSTDNSGDADSTTDSTSDSPTDLFPDWDEIRGRVPIWKQRQPRRPASTSSAPEDESFRALNLQDRFWTRLQSLATNPDLSATLGFAEPTVDDGTHADMGSVPLAHVAELATRKRQAGLDADLTAHEIVVEDEPPVVTKPLEAEPEISEADLSLSPILPEDEPIPTPRLQLPTGELTADQPIQLTVKLPNLLARVYVKLWLRDRQTRELLGTPRWIIDFVPDGFGNQMARTEITVPPGCLKVQFEAIAVEIATQRESDKTTMTRPVVPPDLSPYSLDKLEI